MDNDNGALILPPQPNFKVLTKEQKRILELESDLAKSKKRTKELGDSLNRMYSDACQKVGKLESVVKEIHSKLTWIRDNNTACDPTLKQIKQLCEKCIDGLGEKKCEHSRGKLEYCEPCGRINNS